MSFPGSILLSGADVLQTTTTKRHPLGTRGYTRDGRVFRYARNGATALVPGKMVQSSADSTLRVVKAGTTKISANSSKVTALTTGTGIFTSLNYFADGYLSFNTSSTAKGAGMMAQIKYNSTQTATATGKVVFNFHSGDAFYAAAGTTYVGTTSAYLRVILNPYDRVIVRPTANASAAVVGVPVRPVAASAYFWVQTWGPCCCDVQGSNQVAGRAVFISSGSSRTGNFVGTSVKATTLHSSVGAQSYSAAKIIAPGILMAKSTTGKYNMVFIKFAP